MTAARARLRAADPSLVAGAFSVAVFVLSVAGLALFTDLDLARVLPPFAAGFALFMAVYFASMLGVGRFL